ncbi:MAG: hypothetical protein ACYDCL_15970 [Myxococcales bacterium]
MRLTGDEGGIQALKALSQKDGEYLKFLIREARSNTDLRTRFKSPEGVAYVLQVDPKTGDLSVSAG